MFIIFLLINLAAFQASGGAKPLTYEPQNL
jgi:hypothetical protein